MKRTALALSLILALLVSAVAGTQFIGFTSANPLPAPPISHAYIKADGSIDPSTIPIKRVGNVYTFLNDILNYTIEVQCANVVIDGAGFLLQGHSNYWDKGITVPYRNNVTVKNVNINAFGHGISLEHSSNNYVIGNKINSAYCVYLDFSDGNQIAGNDMSSGYGVSGVGSSNSIMGNHFTSGLTGGGHGIGIEITGNSNMISENLFVDEISIELGLASQYKSQYNNISLNTILNGRCGILVIRASYNTIFGNIFKGKTDSRTGCIYLSDGCFSNTVLENQFENNALCFSLGAQVAKIVWNNVYDNSFYKNNFLNNGKSVFIADGAPPNFWDNGKEGNFWSDYNGSDLDGDGIGDTPRIINANNADNYPLMKPVLMADVPIIELSFPSSTPSPISPNSSSNDNSSPSPIPQDTQPHQTDQQNPINQQSEPFPTALVAVASVVTVVLVGIGLLVYFRKRRGSRNP